VQNYGSSKVTNEDRSHSGNVSMTEQKKTTATLIPGQSLDLEHEALHSSSKLLELINGGFVADLQKIYKQTYKAASLLLDPTTAKLFATPFHIGHEKTLFYGNPITMCLKSRFIAGMIDALVKDVLDECKTTPGGGKDKEPFHFAATSKLQGPDLSAFLSVWLHINGMPSNDYFLGLQEYESSFPHDDDGMRIRYITNILTVLLKMWDWIKYFDVDISTHAFSGYLDCIVQGLEQIYTTTRGINISLPADETSQLQDLHEQLKVLIANDELEPIGDCAQDLRSLIRLVLGEIKPTHCLPFSKLLSSTYVWGYPNKAESARLAKIEEKERLQLEREMKDNRSAWEALGPAPYPKNYELYWPEFYPNADWKRNTVCWDLYGEPMFDTGSVPAGGYKPDSIVQSVPLDYPNHRLLAERKKRGIVSKVNHVNDFMNSPVVLDFNGLYPSIMSDFALDTSGT